MNGKHISKYLWLSVTVLGLMSCNSIELLLPDAQEVLLDRLDEMAVAALRQRNYESSVSVEAISLSNCIGNGPIKSLPDRAGAYQSYMAVFTSDGLRQYARITVPTNPPLSLNGYPFILFLHGWIGKDKAPGYSIGCSPDNLYYSELTDAFARAGFAVLAPGYRGHASIDGVSAEGIEYLEAFDQGAGLSTQYYAIDALNFAAGIADMNGTKFPDQSFKFDMSRFFMIGHSQGGDAGLTYLAAIGEGHRDDLKPIHSALWSGTFLDHLSALEIMMPVVMTPDAFLSGDGRWTGTALGKNGEINLNFIYGFPPDYIETPNPEKWTWQRDQWSEPDVKSAAAKSTEIMYKDLEAYVGNLDEISFSVSESEDGSFSIQHDPRIADTFPQIGGFNQAQYLSENLTLHVPEKDYYSRIDWNRDLCDRIAAKGGSCKMIIYPHNNHSMRASKYEWFSPTGTEDGYPQMIKNMAEEFSTYMELD